MLRISFGTPPLFANRKVRQRQTGSVPDTLPETLHPVIRRILLARDVTDEQSLDLKLAPAATTCSAVGYP